jgi:hypothetical protein
MSQKTTVEMISRRRTLGMLGAGVAFGMGAPVAVLTASDAEAQTPGAQTPRVDQRQDRPDDGTERRQQRPSSRAERRQARRTDRTKRRMARQEGRKRRRMARRPSTTGTSSKGTGPTGTGTTGQGPARQ